MTTRASAVIIDSHLLVREALASLIEGHSYRVVCRLNSIAEIGDAAVSGGAPKLVILGEQSINDAINGAIQVRKVWPDSKVVWLFEQSSAEEVQRLLDSTIDGCVPLCASPETLIHTLDVVLSGDERIMFLVIPQHLSIQPPIPGGDHTPEDSTEEVRRTGTTPKLISLAAATTSAIDRGNSTNGCGMLNHTHDAEVANPHRRHFPHLSERETQILDSLVKGHANKVIARTYDISEATVKVHMKSVLRKIQVANRTQAAIWALEHGFSPDEIKSRLISAAEE